MNILFLCRLYYPHIGGVEKHVERISGLLSKKHKITIITEQHDPGLKEQEIINGVKIFRIPLSGVGDKQKKWVIWKWFLSHLYLLSQADIIHIHDVFFWFLPFRLPYLFKKTYMTFHGYEGSLPPGTKQVFWHKLAQVLTHGNICIGDFHKKWYGTRPDIVSYGAVDPIPGSNRRANAVFIGRPDPDTGFEVYKQVAKRLKLKLDTYTNIPNADRLLPRYKFAFVSRYLAILEALASGTPVLAHYDSPIKKDYLYLAPFAPYIKIFTRPQEASLDFPKQMIANGQKWARLQTWEKLVSQYEILWQK